MVMIRLQSFLYGQWRLEKLYSFKNHQSQEVCKHNLGLHTPFLLGHKEIGVFLQFLSSFGPFSIYYFQ